MVITLCKTYDDKRKINKKITKLESKNVRLKNPTDILNPIFLLENADLYNLNSFNYLYCEKFGRYYFTDPPEILTGYILSIQCHVDALYSYRAALNAKQILVTRQEFKNSAYIHDPLLPVFTNRLITRHSLGELTDNDGGCNIAITVTGGTS